MEYICIKQKGENMKKMTMRDIADIVLVVVGFTFFIRLLGYLFSMGIGAIMSSPETQIYKKSNIPIVLIQTIYILILWGCVLLLMIKRNTLLNLIFPKAEKKAFELASSAKALADYVFWIRLVGVILFLSSGIKFISHWVSEIIRSKKDPYLHLTSFWWTEGIPGLVSFIMAIVVIWKADYISQFLHWLGRGKTAKIAGRKNW
jgi:hypothetical protein